MSGSRDKIKLPFDRLRVNGLLNDLSLSFRDLSSSCI
jgi:hypothetical protein